MLLGLLMEDVRKQRGAMCRGQVIQTLWCRLCLLSCCRHGQSRGSTNSARRGRRSREHELRRRRLCGMACDGDGEREVPVGVTRVVLAGQTPSTIDGQEREYNRAASTRHETCLPPSTWRKRENCQI